MIIKGKYTVLEYPSIDSTSLHTVRVIGIFDNPTYGRLIRYKYNWPFTIVEEVPEELFKEWIAKEIK